MDCPHCRSELVHEAHNGEDIDICPACGGLWIDVPTIRRLIRGQFAGDEPEDLFTEPNLGSPLACPRCEGAPPLLEVGFHGVDEIDLDLCKSCHGLFVPDEEAQAITRLLKWLEDEGPERPIPALAALELIRTIVEAREREPDRPSWDTA